MVRAKVLVIGSGAREHCITWKLSVSEQIECIYVCPGNGGTSIVSKAQNVNFDYYNFEFLAQWCEQHDVKLVFVGPERPLSLGITNALEERSILCFGPRKEAAEIESSKSFAKAFMNRHGIPTARWEKFNDAEKAKIFIRESSFNAWVVKADGLAEGKGVIVADSVTEACAAVDVICTLKDASQTILIEEKLCGDEVSLLAFSDGSSIIQMPPARDYKRLSENNDGPNTGGMGAVSSGFNFSVPNFEKLGEDILLRAIKGLRSEGRKYVGVIYAGLMLTEEGPFVLEFNCRFGDPECSVLLPLLENDLFELICACFNCKLDSYSVTWKPLYCTSVVLASQDYPWKKCQEVEALHGIIFHGGTQILNSQFVTNGGRIINVVTMEESFAASVRKAQIFATLVNFEGKRYRRDIGVKEYMWHHLFSKKGLTYETAGVNISASDHLVKEIKEITSRIKIPGCLCEIGLFGALYDLKLTYFSDPILVMGTDGVGTKLKIAIECNKFDTIGVDLVAMCVNDLLTHGAKPLCFLDYFSAGKLNTVQASRILKGVVDACSKISCSLVGGETAELPDLLPHDAFDVAGFSIGASERDKLLPRNNIEENDLIIGLSSSGAHSNGYSLIRKVLAYTGTSLNDPFPYSERTLGEVLLEPTIIYVNDVLPFMQTDYIKAAAHITGGGLLHNISRILPEGMTVRIDFASWFIPYLFGWLAVADEMLKVFNMGIGFALVMSKNDYKKIRNELDNCSSCRHYIIGSVISGMDPEIVNLEFALKTAIVPFLRISSSVVKKRVAVLISGTGTNLKALLGKTLYSQHAEIVLVVSNKREAEGLNYAIQFGVPHKIVEHKNFKGREEFDRSIHELLCLFSVDIVCLAGFMRMLSPFFVNEWKGKMLNIHPSLLPSFKGLNAQEQALEAGVRISGCSLHFVTENMDEGAIILQESVPVFPDDDVANLSARIREKEHIIYFQALELLASEKICLTAGGKVLWK